MLRATTSPITVPANHSIAGSVNCYDHDLAHNRASELQCCLLREMLRASTLLITVPTNHSIAGSMKCYEPDLARNRWREPQYR